ncbi:Sporulation specific protein [Mycoblastus sanguinarius]|nr:Sporulation specific protein [Mycoblastus sanguinarius]
MAASDVQFQQLVDIFKEALEQAYDKLIEKQRREAGLPPLTPPKPVIPMQPVIAMEQPIIPPEPVTPLQPVIALEQPITPPQPLPEPPPSIEKEKEISINGTSDAMPHQASPKDLYKLPTRCQSPANPVLGFQNFDICTKHFAPSMQFGSPLGYIRDAEKMEATGQG